MKMKSKNIRRKSVAVLAGIAIVGAAGASAASLGGLDSDQLGADTGDVTSCDTNGIDVTYDTTFDPLEGEYMVDVINLNDVAAACAGQVVDLSVLRTEFPAGTPLAALDFSDTADASGLLAVSVTGVTAESVTGLAISISGVPVP